MTIRFSFTIEGLPKWYYHVFPCRHEMLNMETNPFTDGSKQSWIECRKCGMNISKAQEHCEHEVTSMGLCWICNKRLKYLDCKHEQTEKEEDYKWCTICGKKFFDLTEVRYN